MTRTRNRQRGDLVRLTQDNKFTVLEHNQPYGVLQQRKRLYTMQGIPKDKLKITYPHY